MTADNCRNGQVKGVIPHSPSAKDELNTRILALLDATRSSSGTNFVEAGIPATGSDAAQALEVDHEASRHLPESLNVEAPYQTSAGPTASTSSTSSSGAPHPGDSRPLDSNNSRLEIASEQNSRPQPASELIVPTNSSTGSTKFSTRSTPQQDWTRKQRESERQQKEECERIKAQIQHDHAERRQLEELRRRPSITQTSHNASNLAGSTSRRANSSDVRIQVRTFEGSTFRSIFPKTATISSRVRPWIESTAPQRTPYNLKIILTPLPNRTIEAAEEEMSLEDLDLVGSCNLVMVPVKGFVESYAPTGSGLIGSAVCSGYSLLGSLVGSLVGGVRSVLGFGLIPAEQRAPSRPQESLSKPAVGQVRIRTLADQRTEAQRDHHHFYNGNQLNFEPRRDEEGEMER